MATIDHLVRFVTDLDAGIADAAARFGVRPVHGGRHVGRGTHNALLALGTCYLELIAADPGQPAPSAPRPFGIDDLVAPTYVTFAVRPAGAETLDDLVAALRAIGVDPGEPAAMSRSTPAGDELHWRLTTPDRRFGGTVPFLIDWGDTPMPHTTAPVGPELTSLSVTTPDPDIVAAVVDALGLGSQVDVRPGASAITPTFTART